jgi:hypothetical protein
MFAEAREIDPDDYIDFDAPWPEVECDEGESPLEPAETLPEVDIILRNIYIV